MRNESLNPKSSYLLEAALHVLHFESQEWIDTIAFWKDEIKFFDNLLKEKQSKEERSIELKKIFDDLESIHKQLFHYIEMDIIAHEKLLSEILKGKKGMGDAEYRDKHRRLQFLMEAFANEFKTFKLTIFSAVKKTK